MNTTIEEFLPTSDELKHGIASSAPPIPEQIYYLEKISCELGFFNPKQIAVELLACAVWDKSRGTLRIDGKPVQLFLRNLVKEKPELAKPDGEARIGQQRFQRLTCAEAKAIEERLAAERVTRMRSAERVAIYA